VTQDERTAWLAGLKVGDEVAVKSRNTTRIKKLTRATPTLIGIETSETFDRTSGMQRGKRDRWDFLHIEPVTDDIRNTLVRSRIMSRLVGLSWSTVEALTLDQLRRITAILDEKEGTEKDA
jgi:hypothetical protein